MLRKIGSFTIGTLLSRITGLLRESVFAYLYGASNATDAFQVAFRIPNLLRDLFSEAALSASFVPTFAEKVKRQEALENLWRFASNLFNIILLFLGGLVFLGILFSPALVKVLAMGYKSIPEKLALTSDLTRIMLPFLLFVSLASLMMGILFSFGKFFLPAFAPSSFNLVSILVPLITFSLFPSLGKDPIYGMAYGVLFGAVAQFLCQVPVLKRQGFRWTPYLNLKDTEARRVFYLWLPMVAGLAAYQVNFAVNTFLVTFLEEKSLTYLNYSYRIMHLPAGLFGVAIGTVALQEFAAQEREELKKKIEHALRLASLFTLPLSAILIGLAYPVSCLLYERGRFTKIDTLFTSRALFLYTFSVFPAAGVRVISSSFYSLKDTKTPASIAFFIVALNILINLFLMRYLRYLSFPLATSFVSYLNLFLLAISLRKRIGPFLKRGFFFFLPKIFLLSLLLGLFSHYLSNFLRSLKSPPLFQVGLPALFALFFFYLLSFPLQMREVRDIFKLTFPSS